MSYIRVAACEKTVEVYNGAVYTAVVVFFRRGWLIFCPGKKPLRAAVQGSRSISPA